MQSAGERTFKMKRSTWMLLIDAVALASFLFLIATGLLVRYVLPAGSGGIEGYGTGWRAAARPVSLVWGLSRHEWGDIHFWISVVFLLVIAAHLFIHWRGIVASFRGKGCRESRFQAAIGVGALAGLLALAIALVASPARQISRYELQQKRVERETAGSSTLP